MLASAAMHDNRIVGGFPGGVLWLRAGRGAEGRLLRMMELAVCQVRNSPFKIYCTVRLTLFR